MKVNLFNSKDPNGLRIPITVNIVHEDEASTNDGELIFRLTLDTGAIDTNGDRIDTVVIENVTQTTFKRELAKGLATIADQIDWGTLRTDTHSPLIEDIYPENNQINVPLGANVYIKLREAFPATGIDPSTIKLIVNNIDVTNELNIKNRDLEANITWIPKRVY